MNQELNAARNTMIKAAEQNQNEVEKAQILAALKQSKYALLKPEQHLTEKQQLKLEEVKAISPLLASMHQHQGCI